jgi:2',3'-cyclic-nucleotide 2'-phosphodiesterase (5'-nucleotidase family)
LGGLSRRATLIETQRTVGATVVVDGGDLLGKSSTVSPALLEQGQEKGALMLSAMTLVGLDAWVPGEADWALGRDFVLGLVEQHDVPVLAGNLRCGEKTFPGHRVVERGGLRLGFIGVVEDAPPGCTVDEPVKAAVAAAQALGPVDLLVGIVHGNAQLDGRVLEAVPEMDFFFNGHTGQSQANPRQVKGSWFLGAGRRGKQIGRLELSWDDQEGPWASKGEQAALEARMARYTTRVKTAQKDLKRAENEKMATRLEGRIAHHQAQADKIREEIAVMAQAGSASRHFHHSLEDLGRSVENHGATEAMLQETLSRMESAASSLQAGVANGSRSLLPFVGSALCASCHPDQNTQWKTTRHAHAWQTLVDRKRSLDSECFSCHVTGAHHPEGPQLAIETTGLTDVGCEACHGPGAAHVEKPVGTMRAKAAEERCLDCHDGVQDEGRFDAATYLPRVRH